VEDSTALDPGPEGPAADDGADDTRTLAAVLPAVVAVVVTHDPGPWFEEALTSLVAQDYPNLSVLVLDNASAVDPTPRIAAVAPRAFVRRLDDNRGPGHAVNVASTMVEGAPFFLVCHDDVALAPNTVRLLVEEAYRSNAGVVGPKLVEWDRPDALLAVGMGADRFGVPFPLCERGELDQEQHDAVRDVFFVPGACFLIRSDLLSAVGGFDEEITLHGEDTDLCWRIHLAGARVLVAPAARVRHVEALGERRADDRRRLQMRHRLRMVATNYRWFHLLGELVQEAALGAVELLLVVLTGRFRHAADLVSAWVWNARRVGSIVAKRRKVAALRQVTDLEIRRLHVRGSARATSFLRGQFGGDASATSLGDLVRQWLVRRGAAAQPTNVVVAAVVGIVLALGSRHLLTRSVPALGQFAPFPDSARSMLQAGWSGWLQSGSGSPGSAPTGLVVFGLAGLAGTGLVRTVAVVGAFPVALAGLWRLGSFTVHSRAKGAMVLAYVANPLPYNALTTGRWAALWLYAALPWVVRALARAGSLEPFALGTGPDLGGRRRRLGPVATVALAVAAVVLVAPVAAAVVALTVAALVLGSLLAGGRRGLVGVVVTAVAGIGVGLAMHAPWLVDAWRGEDPSVRSFGGTGGAAEHQLTELVHFYSGRLGGAWVTWGLLLAGAVGLAIGRGWRLAWAVRGWTLYAVPLGLVALVQAGVLDIELPPAEVLLAPAALGLSLAVGAAMAAFDLDLRGYRFGWRQVASVVAAGALLLACLPVLLAAVDGRWYMARGGHDRALGFLDEEQADRGPFRVLWLGGADMLPVAGWPLGDGATTFATTIGYPSLQSLWSGPSTGAIGRLPDDLERARRGGDNRLGRRLGVFGIRYVVVVDRLAPAPFDAPERPAAAWLDATLSSQLDLARVDLNSALRIYRNEAWLPFTALVPAGATTAADLPFPDAAGEAAPALVATGDRRFEGALADGDVLHLAESADPGWELTVEGGSAEQGEGFGYANRYEVTTGGPATLAWSGEPWRRPLAALQIVAWLIVVAVAVAGGRPTGRRSTAAPSTPEPSDPAGEPEPDPAGATAGSDEGVAAGEAEAGS